MKTTITKVALTAAMLVSSSTAFAADSFNGNIGATSNYVWRGLTQTADQSAISGGLDYAMGIGVYFGTWTSNTSFGSEEVDLYAGYQKKFGKFNLDAGVISYNYPQTLSGVDLDWNEVFVGFDYDIFSAKLSITTDVFATSTDAIYLEGAVSFEVAKNLTLGIHVGKYEFDNEAAVTAAGGPPSYTDVAFSLSKGEFTFSISDTDLNEVEFDTDDDPRVWVSWAIEFDLLK